jgi:hypothetical protein
MMHVGIDFADIIEIAMGYALEKVLAEGDKGDHSRGPHLHGLKFSMFVK